MYRVIIEDVQPVGVAQNYEFMDYNFASLHHMAYSLQYQIFNPDKLYSLHTPSPGLTLKTWSYANLDV
jgi:hypothetical protein